MTAVEQVRVLIPDLSVSDPLFTDAEIGTFLEIYADNVRMAAAAAIDAVAVNEALLYKVVRTDDLQVNGVSGAEVLRKRAQALREEASGDDEAFVIVFAPRCPTVPEGTIAPNFPWGGRGWR